MEIISTARVELKTRQCQIYLKFKILIFFAGNFYPNFSELADYEQNVKALEVHIHPDYENCEWWQVCPDICLVMTEEIQIGKNKMIQKINLLIHDNYKEWNDLKRIVGKIRMVQKVF